MNTTTTVSASKKQHVLAVGEGCKALFDSLRASHSAPGKSVEDMPASEREIGEALVSLLQDGVIATRLSQAIDEVLAGRASAVRVNSATAKLATAEAQLADMEAKMADLMARLEAKEAKAKKA